MLRLTGYIIKMASNRYLMAGLVGVLSEEYDRECDAKDKEEYIESCEDHVSSESLTFNYFTNYDGYGTTGAVVTVDILTKFLESKGLSVEGFPRNVVDTKVFTRELIEFLKNIPDNNIP